ncbi:GNAT family N-acetyltransferase [Kitasatospora sp. NBC_01287]|uniref:GNAT family N-acetyltransferase n=1 Tax=Kitasatospora sp. NBC_01287 TaxID=2903573 RepID=UPI002254388A|nr:GNAT family N-acetyltransferase [Kitasatospora sp. NBC_01287]MCX4749867.1 GNAT family N-acetyltransferase [Kitasatospora sp. NBC_01287]
MSDSADLPDLAELLDAYDQQLRDGPHGPDLARDQDGPLLRLTGDSRAFVTAPRDLGLTGAALDALIARQQAHFAARGRRVEWKVRGHDLPTELPERLLAAGFVPEQPATVLVGRTERLALPAGRDPALPAGVGVRRTTDPGDADRIAELESAVWGQRIDTIAPFLKGRLAADPEGIAILLAEADGQLVSAGWLTLPRGCDFAGLWGGATLERWRGRGVYQALVAHRARIAQRLGHRYLQVDASAQSAPILRRLGLAAITTCVRYVWTPPPLPRPGEGDQPAA